MMDGWNGGKESRYVIRQFGMLDGLAEGKRGGGYFISY